MYRAPCLTRRSHNCTLADISGTTVQCSPTENLPILLSAGYIHQIDSAPRTIMNHKH
ncbi:hypothetical protein IG631_23448 [Alternaria alternata]|nr:hypothetical protein IG631_23448 [Alternaria alternata]